jgi:magnesium chelatase family protein
MDLQKYVSVVNFFEEKGTSKVTSAELRERVARARSIQQKRYREIDGVNCNAQLDAAMINEFCRLDQTSQELLQKACDRFRYSGRTIHKFMKIARTFADLDGAKDIRKVDMMKSLMSRDLDKDQQVLLTV